MSAWAKWDELAPDIRERVNPNVATKATSKQVRDIVLTFRTLGWEGAQEQRNVLSRLLGRTVHSRSQLTASEAAAVQSVLDEEGAG